MSGAVDTYGAATSLPSCSGRPSFSEPSGRRLTKTVSGWEDAVAERRSLSCTAGLDRFADTFIDPTPFSTRHLSQPPPVEKRLGVPDRRATAGHTGSCAGNLSPRPSRLNGPVWGSDRRDITRGWHFRTMAVARTMPVIPGRRCRRGHSGRRGHRNGRYPRSPDAVAAAEALVAQRKAKLEAACAEARTSRSPDDNLRTAKTSCGFSSADQGSPPPAVTAVEGTGIPEGLRAAAGREGAGPSVQARRDSPGGSSGSGG